MSFFASSCRFLLDKLAAIGYDAYVDAAANGLLLAENELNNIGA